MPNRRPEKRTEKVQLMLTDEELATIDEWRFSHRIPTRAAAIRELLRRGLVSADAAGPAPNAPSGRYGVIDDVG